MLNTDRQGLWTVVRPAGEMAFAVAVELRAAVLKALGSGDRVAIDFSEVTFLDSTGLSVIASAVRETKALGTNRSSSHSPSRPGAKRAPSSFRSPRLPSLIAAVV